MKETKHEFKKTAGLLVPMSETKIKFVDMKEVKPPYKLEDIVVTLNGGGTTI